MLGVIVFFFFKQKTAYEMRISDWSSDVCSSDLLAAALAALVLWHLYTYYTYAPQTRAGKIRAAVVPLAADVSGRDEEVHVRDNQVVRKRELLFTIDRVRLRNALAPAEAAVAVTRADRKRTRLNSSH